MNAVVNKAFRLEKMLTSVTSYLKRNSQVLPTVVEVMTLCTPIGCLTTDLEETHTHIHKKRHSGARSGKTELEGAYLS